MSRSWTKKKRRFPGQSRKSPERRSDPGSVQPARHFRSLSTLPELLDDLAELLDLGGHAVKSIRKGIHLGLEHSRLREVEKLVAQVERVIGLGVVEDGRLLPLQHSTRTEGR